MGMRDWLTVSVAALIVLSGFAAAAQVEQFQADRVSLKRSGSLLESVIHASGDSAADRVRGRLSSDHALAGVALPDAVTLDRTELHLNGIALRTYSWLRIHIYVAGLYLEHPSHDAEAILESPEKKLLVVRFVRDVDTSHARDAWREGFENNCRAPCHLAPSAVERFLAAVPAMRTGDRSMLAFTPEGLQITMNGRTLGTITDPVFSRAVLATFIGPEPPTVQLKRELLNDPE